MIDDIFGYTSVPTIRKKTTLVKIDFTKHDNYKQNINLALSINICVLSLGENMVNKCQLMIDDNLIKICISNYLQSKTCDSWPMYYCITKVKHVLIYQ